MLQRTSYTFVFSALAALAGPVSAEVVTSVPIGLNSTVITFGGFDAVTTPTSVNAAPINLNGTEAGLTEDVFLSLDNVSSGFFNLGSVNQDFGSNGTWPRNGAFAGLNPGVVPGGPVDQGGSINFTFSRNLNFVGGYINYKPGDGNAGFTAYDENGDEIGFTDLTFNLLSPGVQTEGMFIGFRFDDARIRSITLSNFSVSIDDLTFGTTQTSTGIPEPATTALVLASLGALTLARRRPR